MVLGKWKHPNIVRSRMEKNIKPNFGMLALEDVEPCHIDAMLQTVVKRGAPTMANGALRRVRRMFDYTIKHHMVRFNPAAAFDLSVAGNKEVARDRALSRDELKTLFEVMSPSTTGEAAERARHRRERIAPDRAERRAVVRPGGQQRAVRHDLNTFAGHW